ncbi:hypothetical protein [Listeria ivanovii]|uniref:hypothetical protein n=1 Tax=Listeria ivanovii TaxID=1638 RepID=UPI0005126FC3|nr:hypothetical protein [Listeria ivanovii]AIS61342.1 hypothetical protein JL53_00685 [Listeria ivanovii subsp. londoniensis]EDN9201668.1 hypothetical protein [Listeria monocytogenes]EDN9412503.1 hypothetical protein [Listeria monocytogenes]
MTQTKEREYVIRAGTKKKGPTRFIVEYSKIGDMLVFSTSKLRPVIYESEAKALIALQEMKVRFPELRFEAIEMKEEAE